MMREGAMGISDRADDNGHTLNRKLGNGLKFRMEQSPALSHRENPHKTLNKNLRRERAEPGSIYCTYPSLLHFPPFPGVKQNRVEQETPNS